MKIRFRKTSQIIILSLCVTVFCAGVLMAAYGIYRGETERIRTTGGLICLSCIGVGTPTMAEQIRRTQPPYWYIEMMEQFR